MALNANVLDGADQGVLVLVQRMKREVKRRGGSGIAGLARKFRIMDDDNSKTLSMGEYKKAMKEMNLNFTGRELQTLFEFFDKDGSGDIGYEEFVQGLRDPLSKRRQKLVRMAFAKIDLDGSGAVEPAEIASKFDASNHPEVKKGNMTPEDVYREFLATFEVEGDKDGKVTEEEFMLYYTNIGAGIDNDDYFELMIRNAWHISGGEGWCANSSNRRVLVTNSDGSQSVQEVTDDLGLKADDKEGTMARLSAQGVNASNISMFDGAGDMDTPAPRTGAGARNKKQQSTNFKQGSSIYFGRRPPANSTAQSAKRGPSRAVEPILEKLRSQLKKRGTRGIVGIGRKFRIMDDDGSDSIDMEEFKKGMRETGLVLDPNELEKLFRHFDRDGSGDIEYDEFLRGLRGQLNPRRKKLVNMAFDVMDKDGNGVLEPNDVVGSFDASQHPDVKKGIKTENDVLMEFLDTFDCGGEHDGKVTRKEFETYYENVSASIDLDDYFELMIRNAWHISGGEGWCANSSNRRVLVTMADGSQSVQEIKNDLGLKADDSEGAMARLRAQGVTAEGVSLADAAGDA